MANFNLNSTLSQDDNDESNDLISLKTLTSCDYYDATEFNNLFNAPNLNDRSFKISHTNIRSLKVNHDNLTNLLDSLKTH